MNRLSVGVVIVNVLPRRVAHFLDVAVDAIKSELSDSERVLPSESHVRVPNCGTEVVVSNLTTRSWSLSVRDIAGSS